MYHRLAVQDIDPAAHQALLGLEGYLRSAALERPLRKLIKIRGLPAQRLSFLPRHASS